MVPETPKVLLLEISCRYVPLDRHALSTAVSFLLLEVFKFNKAFINVGDLPCTLTNLLYWWVGAD